MAIASVQKSRIYGKPIDEYKGKCTAAKAMQVMIDNNLSFEIALYPYELVTYGETGSVCANWMQYNLIKKYLEVMTEDQTLWLNRVTLLASSNQNQKLLVSSLPTVS